MLLIVGHDGTRTGAPRSLLNFVIWLAENTSMEFEILLNNGGPLVDEYKKYASVDIWNTQRERGSVHRSLFDSFFNKKHSQEQLLLEKFRNKDISCIFNNTGVNGHLLEKLKTITNAPIVSRIPELEAYMRKNNRDGSSKKILEVTDYFIAVSNAVKNNLSVTHNISETNISVVYGTCATSLIEKDKNALREKLSLPINAFLVIGCGTMDWRKGIDLFLQTAKLTFTELTEENNLHFVWVGGDTNSNAFIEFSYELEMMNIDNRVTLVGEVENTSQYFASSDLFLLTSREDPFPLVMLEAARQKLPIICFDAGGGAIEFVNNTIGSVVPMWDTRKMAANIIDLYRSTTDRLILGEAAHRKSLEFTPDVSSRQILDAVMSVQQQK